MIYSNGPKTARFIGKKETSRILAVPRRTAPNWQPCALVRFRRPEGPLQRTVLAFVCLSPTPCGTDIPVPFLRRTRSIARLVEKTHGFPYPASPIPYACV